MDILHIDFLEGIKKENFDLNLKSHFSTDSGGVPWESRYHIVINDSFLRFWQYIKRKYGVDTTTQKEVSFKDVIPISALISQKTRGIDNKGYPWISKLEVSDENQTECIIFHPNTCSIVGLTMKNELVEDKKISRRDFLKLFLNCLKGKK